MSMRRFRLLTAFVLGAAGLILPARAQNAPPAAKTSPEKAAADDLQKEADAFAKGVAEQSSLDDTAKVFVTKVALRKLRQAPDQRRLVGGEKLDATVDRIRDVLSGPKGTDAAAGQRIREAAATWLVEQARAADPGVAANAALLLGDLQVEGKPWIEGSKRLAALVADTDLKPAVRAAAVAGLSRQVDDFASKPPVPPELIEAVTPSLVAVVTTTAPSADPAARWLVSRSLDVVAKVVPTASPELAKALVAVVSDRARSTDERVRAAVALGRAATKESGVDAAGAVMAVRQLAADALADSLATAKDRALAAALSNMPVANLQQPGLPGAGPSLPVYPLDELEIERDAWRLLKLSEAIARPKLKKDKSGALQPSWGELEGGLSRLLDDNSAAIELAKLLRSEAVGIDLDKTASRVAEAHETILTWSPGGG